MPTPKLNLLAKRFMRQIQDPITEDAGVILPGQIIRTVPDIEHYLGMAMEKFIADVWEKAQGNAQLMLRALPDLYAERECTIPGTTQKVDLHTTHADLLDILDSRKDGSQTKLEAWHPVHLTEALNGDDPFYAGTDKYAGIIYQKPFLWIFPATLSQTLEYDFTLCFIQAPLNPTDGSYLVSGGTYDIPFSDIHFSTICDIAEKLYKVDDYQEDAG